MRELSKSSDLNTVNVLAGFGSQLTAARRSRLRQRLVIDTAIRLVSPRRALLVLQTTDGLQIAAAKLPRGERATELLAAVTPWWDEARHSGCTAALHIGPRGAAPAEQRCCVVAPLTGAQGSLGFLYCDIEGRFGRWGAADRDQMALLASQAALALDNARLLDETNEALAQHSAIAAVLKAIGRSAFDAEPVLKTLVESATRLCGASQGFVLRPDGDVFRLATAHGASPEFEAHIRRIPIRPERGYMIGRAVLERKPVQILDALADPDYANAESQRLGGYRTMLAVPMLGGDDVVGVIVVWRQEVRTFTARHIELLTTFADQAAIAIQNARLFKETRGLAGPATRLGRSAQRDQQRHHQHRAGVRDRSWLRASGCLPATWSA